MILITGASGLLGANLMAVAREQGRDVVGLYHRHAFYLPGMRLVSADLTDQRQIAAIFDQFEPDLVIHCAAATHVDWCEANRAAAHTINCEVPGILARVTAQTRAQMLYISTDAVFDGSRGDYAESDSPTPLNVYAQTKLQGEMRVLEQNPRAAIARVNLYGRGGQTKRSLVEWILDRLALGEVVPAFTDVVFCPISANDLAHILLAMVDRKLSGLYHAVGSEPISKYQFAKRVALAFAFDPRHVVPVLLADAKLAAPRPLNTSLSTMKIRAALEHPMPDVDSGLRNFASQARQCWQNKHGSAEVLQ